MSSRRSVFEVVSAQVLLSKRHQFFALHRDQLLPMLRDAGIRPVICLFTEVGQHGKFYDIYVYDSFAAYEAQTDKLLADPRIVEYYQCVSKCIEGSLSVDLAFEFPHMGALLGEG